MQSKGYRETEERGTADFPLEYYYVDETHPRYEMMYHWHSEYEIIYILEGEMQLNLDGKEQLAKKGDVVFIGDRVCHGGHPNNCVYACFVFDPHLFDSRSNLISKQVGRILNHEIKIDKYIPSDITCITNIVGDMVLVATERKEGYELVLYGQIYRLIGLVLANNLYTENSGGKVSNKSSVNARSRALIKSVIEYIEEHYAEQITLTELAELANMSNKYFCTFFYNYTHRTPIDYVNYYRVECACEQLHLSDKSIIDIAYDTGFNDASYFTKTFKKYIGVTPLSYRKNS